MVEYDFWDKKKKWRLQALLLLPQQVTVHGAWSFLLDYLQERQGWWVPCLGLVTSHVFLLSLFFFIIFFLFSTIFWFLHQNRAIHSSPKFIYLFIFYQTTTPQSPRPSDHFSSISLCFPSHTIISTTSRLTHHIPKTWKILEIQKNPQPSS